LIAQQGATVAACLFLVELTFLAGRARLEGIDVVSLISY
jgi:adenine/guanine phosphoribosyltransferase-like PRPP-binding protein